MRADLHCHSTASDGTLTPQALVELALAEGLDVLSLTDHDSVEGLDRALEAAKGSRLRVIPGVELSAVSARGDDVHILGYFVDPHDAALRDWLETLRRARELRAMAIVAALAEAGYAVDLESVMALSAGGAVGRSHIARALVAAGHAHSVSDAFKTLIGRGRPYYVAKDVRSPAQVISCIRDAGGLAILAHPGVSGLDPLIDELIADGLAGIEAFHADHTDAQRAAYEALADERGILSTGGSDFHGPEAPNAALGSVEIPARHVDALLRAGERLADGNRL